ncbi:hypothetical protein Emtol_0530 [Emticicia oligotrophica DSM 17448]|uniref:DUF3037 domain-containing protein n=1 Tax=Emticicia oligotrophica (strain DSM 17448 / CIP 109782 / MTCC 6937 / GPTSA100-15) TaxID=929562 RepID=A0ABN4ADX1_EMTOG|nr:DUF3037 domain-containing protein [Emticicia oligotrophica]AFK01684.1 hypothetical protein Emtol_0530 [Emticicia oligotrophica DSM 17448]
MQEKVLYEYAVIRVVPKVEREEFLNVGIILYCAKQHFLKSVFKIDEARIRAFSSNIDCEELNDYLETWQKICSGGKNGGPIGSLAISARFRWLTATRSTIIQTSKVHPGYTQNAEETMNCLFNELVL